MDFFFNLQQAFYMFLIFKTFLVCFNAKRVVFSCGISKIYVSMLCFHAYLQYYVPLLPPL